MTSQTNQTRANQVRQVQELRKLCRLMMQQQENFFRRIADRLDALEVDLIVAYAKEADDAKGGTAHAK